MADPINSSSNMLPVGIESSSGGVKPSSAYEISRQRSRLSATYEPREIERPRKLPSNWVIAGAVSMLVIGVVSNIPGMHNSV